MQPCSHSMDSANWLEAIFVVAVVGFVDFASVERRKVVEV